ncbi:MAG: hypothetical protein HY562_01620 [Ignavibacteriales bacterium]|nr:hypothetical protein [Ignavibacteriales bacterium]
MAWEILATVKANIIDRIAGSHVVGPFLRDALAASQYFSERGWSSTLCPWLPDSESPRVASQRYLRALHGIHREGLDGALSVKLPALRYDFELLREILETAKSAGRRVHFDAQDPESATPAFNVMEKALKVHADLGCTLPARWVRSTNDADRVSELGIAVRVVRGQWPDPGKQNVDAKKCFVALIDRLRGRAKKVIVATHDRTVAERSLSILKESGTPCELELMVGLPLGIAKLGENKGVLVRIYLPYGSPSLPYRLSDVTSRPAMMSWAIRDFVFGRKKRIFREWHDIRTSNSPITTQPFHQLSLRSDRC